MYDSLRSPDSSGGKAVDQESANAAIWRGTLKNADLGGCRCLSRRHQGNALPSGAAAPAVGRVSRPVGDAVRSPSHANVRDIVLTRELFQLSSKRVQYLRNRFANARNFANRVLVYRVGCE